MILITLKPGIQTQISDEDFELCFYNWCYNGDSNYARGRFQGELRYLHHVIIARMNLTVSSGYEIDHEDRNKLNNQRQNLRVVTQSINGHNTGNRNNNISGYKGVHFDRSRNKWLVQIMVDNENIHIGRFNTIEQAIQAKLVAEERYKRRFKENKYDI